MIEHARGNLLEADVEAFVNPVNTVGVMGKGLALQFKKQFKSNYDAYIEACAAGDVRLGEMFVWEEQTLTGRRIIINFPTKRHWRARSRLDDIVRGLDDLRRVLMEREVSSVAVPAVGCGYGGLSWGDVWPQIDIALGGIADIRVLVFGPHCADGVNPN